MLLNEVNSESFNAVSSPYNLFKYAVRTEITRRYYERRIRTFFDFIGFMVGSVIEERCNSFSEVTVSAKHSFIRWHGRDAKHRYNYLYSKDELRPWIDKVKQISTETAVVRGYFNNHYGAKAVVNAIEFKEMLGTALSQRKEQCWKMLEICSFNLLGSRHWTGV